MERRSFLARASGMLAALPVLPRFLRAAPLEDSVRDPMADSLTNLCAVAPGSDEWCRRFARVASRVWMDRGIRVVYLGASSDRAAARFSVQDTTDWRGLESRYERGYGLRATFQLGRFAALPRRAYKQAIYQTAKCAESIDYTRRTGMTRYYDDDGIERTAPYWAAPSL